jgi:hypothetical protein
MKKENVLNDFLTGLVFGFDVGVLICPAETNDLSGRRAG